MIAAKEPIQLTPYVGIDKINFGMSIATARDLLGNAERSLKNRRGESVLTYEIAALTFSSAEEEMVEISFQRNVVLMVSGIDIFNDADAWIRLASIDPPHEYVGILFFQRLGLSITGPHTQDQKVATAISSGRFDSIKGKFMPFNLG